MNKSELVAKLTERLGGDRATAVAAVHGVLEEISHSVARGERVTLMGFGTFDRRERPARTGRNPRTGAAIHVGASLAPTFRPSAGFRSLLTPASALSAEGETIAPPVLAAEAAHPKKKTAKTGKNKAAASAPASPAAARSDTGKSGKKTSKKVTGKNGKKAAKKGS